MLPPWMLLPNLFCEGLDGGLSVTRWPRQKGDSPGRYLGQRTSPQGMANWEACGLALCDQSGLLIYFFMLLGPLH